MAFGGQATAREILEKVSKTYQDLKSFRIRRAATTLEETVPGKVRLRGGGGGGAEMLLVSNGETTWMYLSDLNEYTETAAAPLLKAAWSSLPRAAWRYQPIVLGTQGQFSPWPGGGGARLMREIPHARLRGVDRLAEKEPVDCYVVTFSDAGGAEKLWVDKTRFIVWRWDSLGAGVRKGGRDFEFEAWGSADLQQFDIGPIPDEVFEFIPPQGAARVQSFRTPTSHEQRLDEESVSYFMGVLHYPEVEERRVPGFALEDLTGQRMRLKDLRGKIVVMEFWASWCKPCQKELAEIQTLHEELWAKDVVFLGIVDEDSDTVRSFVTANGYTFPILLDSKHIVHYLYGTGWVPTTLVINRKGKVAARYVGAQGEAGLRKALEAAGLNAGTATKRP
jgi:peroxiredoxin